MKTRKATKKKSEHFPSENLLTTSKSNRPWAVCWLSLDAFLHGYDHELLEPQLAPNLSCSTSIWGSF